MWSKNPKNSPRRLNFKNLIWAMEDLNSKYVDYF